MTFSTPPICSMTFVIFEAGMPLTDLYNVHKGSFMDLRTGVDARAKTSVLKLSIPPTIRIFFRNSLRESIMDLIPYVHNPPSQDFPLPQSFPYPLRGSWHLYVPCLLSPIRKDDIRTYLSVSGLHMHLEDNL